MVAAGTAAVIVAGILTRKASRWNIGYKKNGTNGTYTLVVWKSYYEGILNESEEVEGNLSVVKRR